MYTINNKQKCTIYNSLLYHDLIDHTITQDTSSTYINYSGSSTSNAISIRTSDIESFIESSAATGVWNPAIISDESFVSDKPLFNKQNISNTILGIQGALSFPASFKNWAIQNPDGTDSSASMSTNWYITSIIPTTFAEYGLLFWYKINNITTNSGYLLTDIPDGTVIKSQSSLTYTHTMPSGNSSPPTLVDMTPSIDTSTELIKLNNNTLKIVNKLNNTITGTSTSFWSEYDKFYLDRCSAFDIKTNTFSIVNDNTLTKNSKEYSLWISDGEAFSYFDSVVNKNKSISQSYASKTYLSPILMPIYREIYHALTLRRPRSISSGFTKNQNLLLQKLCYFLSTFPLMDRTTVNILNSQSIYDAVQAYIDTVQTSSSAEITALKTVLSTISVAYNTAHLTDSYNNQQSLKNNYIHNKVGLVKKLLDKYGAQLYVGSDISLKYKPKLSGGPHALLGLSSITMASKNISSSTVLYNNFKLDIGNISYSTDISTTGSVIYLSGSGFNSGGATVPLVDVSVTRYNPEPFKLPNNPYKEFVGSEIYFRDINPNADLNATYYWEQISGPKCLRFTKYNGRVASKTSTDDNPDIYIRQAGTYGIRCTRNSDGIIESDEAYVTTDSSFTPVTASAGSSSSNNKIINGVPRKLGFHKHGMVWFVDTDNYIKDNYTIKAVSSFNLDNVYRLKDVKIDIPKPNNFTPVTSDVDLRLTFLAASGDTTLLIDGINIEHARYKDSIHGQCCSFYEEKIYRKQARFSGPVIGANNFIRDNGIQYNLAYFDNNGEIYNRSEMLSQPSEASTALAPPILSYGGYDDAKINTIGIKMPSHDKNKPIPILDKRNDIVNPDNIYCFLKEVKSSNSDSNIFQRGFFDPAKGFKISSDSNLLGKSLVIDDSLKKQQSFVFKGNGFLSLKPSKDNSLNTYTSTITIGEKETPKSEQYNNHYGYKNYNDPKLNPNFIVDNISDPWFSIDDYSPLSCVGSATTYSFPETGIVKDLYIKDIEVKLNFLNYANPKELIVWLDITPGVPASGGLMEYKGISEFSTNSSLTSYYNSLSGLNSNTTRIYLLNQEHISNYEPNFSITFSDNANKNNCTSSQNSLLSNKYGGAVPISNNDDIQPTRYAAGYDDLNSERYIANIKINQINSANSSLSKFKGIPLQNATFTLNIGFINPLEYPNKIMDNLLVNNLILTGQTTENKTQSSTISNSLCSWELKVNTSDTNKFYNTDVLGKINYAGYQYGSLDQSAVSGYNFIGDFKANPYLIPTAHINAPYNYLANINQCSYDDNTAGQNWSSMRPSADENMRTISLGIMSYMLAGMAVLGGAGTGGAVGALMGIYALQAVYERGGRNDPIINFFIETKLLDQTDVQDAQIYKPLYSKEFFGKPDKAIVCISKDQNYWYTVEVPIFNMFNSFVTKKQEYNYIKLCGNNVPGISNFEYTTIRNYSDLDLAPIVYSYTSNITSLSGEQDSFKEGDMVLLTAQNTNSENGYYIITTSSWVKVPSVASSYFLTYNNISNLLTESSLADQKHILINGFRAYNFFDKNETITLNTSDGISNATISDKSYIQTSSGVKTVLTLNISVAKDGTVSKDVNNANVLWLYKNNFSYSDSQSFNKWLLSKTKNDKAENTDPLNVSSAYGEGSINSGSDILDPEILYKLSLMDSELFETNKILNNESNDKYKFNRVFLSGIMPSTPSSTPTPPSTSPPDPNTPSEVIVSFGDSDTGTSLLKGFSSTLENFLSKPLSDIGFNTEKNDRATMNEGYRLANTVFDIDWSDKQFMEIKSDKFKGTGIIPDSGSLHIENDFKKITPVYFSSGDITSLSNRLSSLSTGIIPGVYAEYYSLGTDPISCYSNYNDSTCPKTASYQRLKVLEAERKNIEIALSLPRSDNGFIPYVSGGLSGNTDGSLAINYTINPYLYWINIDPEQICSLADELSPKVLKNIKMRAVPTSEVDNEGITPGSDSHIVPQTSFQGIPSGLHNASGVYMSTEGLTYSYNMGDETIADSKQEWSTGIIWSTGDSLFRYGDVSSDTGDSKKLMISRLDRSGDMLVIIEENYLRPSGLPSVSPKGKVKDFIDLSTGPLYVKFRNIPRKLKSLDSENFEKYIYDRNGGLIKSSRPASSVGQIANNFTCWHCIDSSGNFTGLPPYYQAANEMRYRAFFGSSDGIENKNTLFLDTKEDWEWIPYEYYSAPANQPIEQVTIDFLNSSKALNSINTDIFKNNYFSTMNLDNTSIQEANNNDDDDMLYLLYYLNYEKYFATKYRFRIDFILFTTYYIGDEYDYEHKVWQPKYKTEQGEPSTITIRATNKDNAIQQLRDSVAVKTSFASFPTFYIDAGLAERVLASTYVEVIGTKELPRLPTDVRYQYFSKSPFPRSPLDTEDGLTTDRFIDFFDHLYFRDTNDKDGKKYTFRVTILSDGRYSLYRYYDGQWSYMENPLKSSVNYKGIYEAAKAPLIPFIKKIQEIEESKDIDQTNKQYLKDPLYREMLKIENNWLGGATLYYKMIYESLGGQIQPLYAPSEIFETDPIEGLWGKVGDFIILKPAWFEEIRFTYDSNGNEEYPSVYTGDRTNILDKFSSAGEYLWNSTKDLESIDQRITRVTMGSKLPIKENKI